MELTKRKSFLGAKLLNYAFTDLGKVKYNESTIIAIIRRMCDKKNALSGKNLLILQYLFTNKKGNLYNVIKSPKKEV